MKRVVLAAATVAMVGTTAAHAEPSKADMMAHAVGVIYTYEKICDGAFPELVKVKMVLAAKEAKVSEKNIKFAGAKIAAGLDAMGPKGWCATMEHSFERAGVNTQLTLTAPSNAGAPLPGLMCQEN